jgi:NifU-like protein
MTTNEPKHLSAETLDQTICYCFGITYGVIREAVRENHFKGIEQVTRYCRAGGGCRGCMGDIRRIIDATRHEFGLDRIEREKSEARTSRSSMPVIKRIRLIEGCLKGEVRAMLEGVVADVKLVHIEGDEVEVKLEAQGEEVVYEEWLGKIQGVLREKVDSYIVVVRAKL